MFHMSNDSHLFRTREQLEADGWTLHGNVFHRGEHRMLPLYEAKMFHHYDHRWATYSAHVTGAPPTATAHPKHDPRLRACRATGSPSLRFGRRLIGRRTGCAGSWLARYRRSTRRANRDRRRDSLTGRRWTYGAPCCSERHPAVLHSRQLSQYHDRFDYVARQKVGGTTSHVLHRRAAAGTRRRLRTSGLAHGSQRHPSTGWITARVLELTYTAWDMQPFARDLGDDGPPFRWDPERRSLLRAELDAAYFHLYGITRDDTDYILDTFPIVKRKDEAAYGEYRTKRLILEFYDRMADAIRTGVPYRTAIDPPPGHGPRHG